MTVPTKPSSAPSWATSGVAGQSVTPPVGLAARGFVPGMRIPAEILNFLFNKNGSWQAWMAGVLDTLTRTNFERVSGAAGFIMSDIAVFQKADAAPFCVAVGVTTPDGYTAAAYGRSPGKTLTLVSNPLSTDVYRSVAVHPTSGVFVAVGDNGLIQTSTDGTTWTTRANPAGTPTMYRVRWLGEQFVAVGASSTILTSPDGITWTQRTAPDATRNYCDVARNTVTGRLIVVAKQASGANAAVSTDGGVSWSSLTVAGLYYSGMWIPTNRIAFGVNAAGAQVWAATTEDGKIYSTTDGTGATGWTLRLTASPAVDFSVVVFDPDMKRWAAAGAPSTSPSRIWWSDDGAAWTAYPYVDGSTYGEITNGFYDPVGRTLTFCGSQEVYLAPVCAPR